MFSGDKDLLNDYPLPRIISTVFTFGIEDEYRGKAWCHLLRAEELKIGYGGSQAYKAFLSMHNDALESVFKRMKDDKICDRSQLHCKNP